MYSKDDSFLPIWLLSVVIPFNYDLLSRNRYTHIRLNTHLYTPLPNRNIDFYKLHPRLLEVRLIQDNSFNRILFIRKFCHKE